MANQDDSSDSNLRPMSDLSMPQLAYEEERSNWRQNHGPILIATAVLVLIVGSGVIFLSSLDMVDNGRPLVPSNFVPDDSTAIEIPDESAPPTDTEPQTGESDSASHTDIKETN